jgi:hypothetical protein
MSVYPRVERDKIKDAVSDTFAKQVFDRPEVVTDDGPLGTHSF